MEEDTIVDLAFPVTAGRVPVDHGYALYSALAERVAELHMAPWLAVHPLSGRRVGETTLILTRQSAVTLRLPASKAGVALRLAEQTIRVGGELFHLGSPTMRALEPFPSLFAWQVAIRLTHPPKNGEGVLDVLEFRQAFETEARRQLTALKVGGVAKVLGKRQLKVKGQVIIAFSVEIEDLNRDDSIRLQAHGIGGKRRMGCGVFRPSKVKERTAQ